MKSIFFFLLPIVTLILFYQTTIVIPDSEIVVSDVYGSNYHDIGYKDNHHVWIGYIGEKFVRDLDTGKYKLEEQTIFSKAYAPTYGYTGSTINSVVTNAGTGTACPTGSYTKGATVATKVGADTSSDTCILYSALWDISTISVFSTITNVTYRVDISASTNGRNCDISQITNNPNSATGPTLWDDIIGNISNTDYLTDQSYCATVANDYVLDLGTTADSDIQAQLDDGWFAIGLKFNNMVRGSVIHTTTHGLAGGNELQITYTTGSPPTAPSQVTGLTATAVSSSEIDLSWTAPSNGGSAITGYKIEYETPVNGGWNTLIDNTGGTGTTLSHTGLDENTQYNYRVSAINIIGTGTASAAAAATTNTTGCVLVPYAVTDLATYTIENNRIGLTWSEPNLLGCSISGYQINYTTPYSSNPVTIIQPNTGSSQVNYLVNLLTKNTQYSFRIATITAGGHNATGNVVNATTTNLGVPDFFPGGLNFTQTNTNDIKIIFERQDINATDIFLNVTYPDTYNMTCNLAYKYAMSNQNYSNLDYVTQGDDRESSFQFHDFTNEVITAKCIDENSDDFGKYVIAQTNFEYLQLVHGFQSGEFGTMGQFGAIDLVTLIVVISAMVGLNSVNETVGGIFLIAILGALWYFNIVSLYTVMLSGVVLVILLIITTTRKD